MVATRPVLPMLSGVRLDASGEGVAVEATDLEITARRVAHDEVPFREAIQLFITPPQAGRKPTMRLEETQARRPPKGLRLFDPAGSFRLGRGDSVTIQATLSAYQELRARMGRAA